MFLGEYQHTLDPKGRVILPSAFRDELGDGLVITIGMDHCLTVHPTADWGDVVQGLRALRTTDRRERMFARMLLSSAHPETLDKQGRITIPGRLRDYAALAKDVTVVGSDARIELWSTPSWVAYRDQAMADFADTEQPFEMGGHLLMANLLSATKPLAASARPLAATAVTVLGRAVATAALQVLVLLAGTAALLLVLFGTLWLSG